MTAPEVTTTVTDLTVSYAAGSGRVVVARDISFTLRKGRTLGLVGESGSGKSTVARTLLAQLRPGSEIDHGTVEVLGTNVFDLRGEELRSFRGRTVALVAQNAGHALTPSMRVGDQVAEVLRVHGMDAADSRVEELFATVLLPDPREIARRYPHELSGGQQQRVAIAMAVATSPQILVLDEPTTALDVVTQASVLSLVNDLRDRLGMSVLIVSHDLGVISAVADEMLVMQQGATVEQGPTRAIMESPSEDYTRRLLDSIPRVHGAASNDETADMPDDVVLACSGVDIRYGRSPSLAVDGFDLELRRGETVAVVGESGSGKSTVASALAGLVAVEDGRIALRDSTGTRHDLTGRASKRPRDVRRSLQLIFQNADLALNPRRSVGDAIERPLRFFGQASSRTEARRLTAELLVEVGLDPDFARRVPGQLSGGQRQRVGIARALAADPTLLLADEITTALDVSVQADVLDLLQRLRETRDLACLFISHDLAVVRQVAERIVVMKDGFVVETAPTDVIFTDPRHWYTRALLDAVVEPGHTDLPSGDSDVRIPRLEAGVELVGVGPDHHVRADEGV